MKTYYSILKGGRRPPGGGFLFMAFASLLLLTSALCPLTSGAALEIANGAATNITSTNAWLVGNLVSTNATNATLTVFYGAGNGGTNPALWQYSNDYGTAASTGLVSILTTNSTSDGPLTPATWYYYRWKAVESTTNIAWAAAAANFSTLATLPTNFPGAGTNGITVMAGTNGDLLTPLALWTANRINIATALDGLIASGTGNVDTVQSNLSDHVADTNNPHAVTPGQIGAASTSEISYLQSQITTNADAIATKVSTNHIGDVSIDGELDMYIGRRTSTNEEYELTELVAYNRMRAEIAQSSALSIYANTNAHPVIAGVTILSREIPDGWCTTNTYTDAGTYLVATRLYTNYVNQLRFGKYILDAAAYKSGLGDLKLYLELITSDGATTNSPATPSIPGRLLTTVQSLSRLLCALETNQPVAAGFYFGYNLYAIKTGVPSTDLILCGGKGSLTSLSTPGLASADGALVEVDPVASSNLTEHVAGAFATVSNAYPVIAGSTNVHVTLTPTGQVVSVDEGGGIADLSGWSGYPATQQVTWIETIPVQTNLTVTGTLTPDVTGNYPETTPDAGGRRWVLNDNYIQFDAIDTWFFYVAGDFRWTNNGTAEDPTGEYNPVVGLATGTATVAWNVISNVIWGGGYDGTNWTITRDGVLQLNATNVPTKVQLAVISNIVAGLSGQSSTWATVTASMSNFTPVASSSNYLSYNSATRTLSGCVTNAGGLGTGDFKADGSVPMTGDLNGGGNDATNFPNLVLTNTPAYQNLVTNTATKAQGALADTALQSESYSGTVVGVTATEGAATGTTTNNGVVSIVIKSNDVQLVLGTTAGTAYDGAAGYSASTNAEAARVTAGAALPKAGGSMTGIIFYGTNRLYLGTDTNAPWVLGLGTTNIMFGAGTNRAIFGAPW